MWYFLIFLSAFLLTYLFDTYIARTAVTEFVRYCTAPLFVVWICIVFIIRADFNHAATEHIIYQRYLNELRYTSTYKEEIYGTGIRTIEQNIWLAKSKVYNSKWWADDFIPDETIAGLKEIK